MKTEFYLHRPIVRKDEAQEHVVNGSKSLGGVVEKVKKFVKPDPVVYEQGCSYRSFQISVRHSDNPFVDRVTKVVRKTSAEELRGKYCSECGLNGIFTVLSSEFPVYCSGFEIDDNGEIYAQVESIRSAKMTIGTFAETLNQIGFTKKEASKPLKCNPHLELNRR